MTDFPCWENTAGTNENRLYIIHESYAWITVLSKRVSFTDLEVFWQVDIYMLYRTALTENCWLLKWCNLPFASKCLFAVCKLREISPAGTNFGIPPIGTQDLVASQNLEKTKANNGKYIVPWCPTYPNVLNLFRRITFFSGNVLLHWLSIV